MLNGFTYLLLLQLAGEAIARVFALPIAGPIIGFVLTLFVLHWIASVRQSLKLAADALLSHLSLLFVPAGVGVVLFLKEIANDGIAIAVAIVFSTWIGLAVTAWVAQRVAGDGADGASATRNEENPP